MNKNKLKYLIYTVVTGLIVLMAACGGSAENIEPTFDGEIEEQVVHIESANTPVPLPGSSTHLRLNYGEIIVLMIHILDQLEYQQATI